MTSQAKVSFCQFLHDITVCSSVSPLCFQLLVHHPEMYVLHTISRRITCTHFSAFADLALVTTYTFVPFPNNALALRCTVQFDMSGEIVLTHQLWRDGRLPKPNFHDAEWAALTPQFGGKVRYNPPDLTIRFDLRMHGGKYR